jgi:hypothetical protein
MHYTFRGPSSPNSQDTAKGNQALPSIAAISLISERSRLNDPTFVPPLPVWAAVHDTDPVLDGLVPALGPTTRFGTAKRLKEMESVVWDYWLHGRSIISSGSNDLMAKFTADDGEGEYR